jgi:hypothetical protein
MPYPMPEKPVDYEEFVNHSDVIFWIPQQVALADIPLALQNFAESIDKDNLYDGTTFYVQVNGSTPMEGNFDVNNNEVQNVTILTAQQGNFSSDVTVGGNLVSATANVTDPVFTNDSKVRNITHSPDAPTAQDGENGDLWVQYEV